jgi:hypothetical protein
MVVRAGLITSLDDAHLDTAHRSRQLTELDDAHLDTAHRSRQLTELDDVHFVTASVSLAHLTLAQKYVTPSRPRPQT